MCRVARAYLVVIGALCIAAGITGLDVGYALDVLKNSLDAPETSTGKYCCLCVFCGRGFYLSRGKLFDVNVRRRAAARDITSYRYRNSYDQPYLHNCPHTP